MSRLSARKVFGDSMFIEMPNALGKTETVAVVLLSDDVTENHEDGSRTIRTVPRIGAEECANRIARCFNVHDDLLGALQGMLEMFVESDQLGDYEDMATVKAARAAISKAKGGDNEA